VNKMNLDVLAIAAHPDDVEQTCGGTLIRMAEMGYRTGALDLTAGDMGTRGSPEERVAESEAAGRHLLLRWRGNLHFPDARLENHIAARMTLAQKIRELQPRVVILPYWQARHPDHAVTGTLGYDACFLAGLKSIDTGAEIRGPQEAISASWGGDPHRPFKIVYASLYADVRPSFVVDITPFIEQRHQALMAYRSQYANQSDGSGLFVPEEEIRERTFAEARHYGLLAGVRYGEPFVQKEVGLVDDLTLLPVQSI
jgi:bacillithiol biosynthesis deacetylase BshB1